MFTVSEEMIIEEWLMMHEFQQVIILLTMQRTEICSIEKNRMIIVIHICRENANTRKAQSKSCLSPQRISP